MFVNIRWNNLREQKKTILVGKILSNEHFCPAVQDLFFAISVKSWSHAFRTEKNTSLSNM